MKVMEENAQKMKVSINDFFCKCDPIRRKLWILSFLLKKSLMETFILYSENSSLSSLNRILTAMQEKVIVSLNFSSLAHVGLTISPKPCLNLC